MAPSSPQSSPSASSRYCIPIVADQLGLLDMLAQPGSAFYDVHPLQRCESYVRMGLTGLIKFAC